MTPYELDDLHQIHHVAQAGIALLFAVVLHAHMQRPAAPAGLGCWSAGMFWRIFHDLGHLLAHRAGSEVPVPIAATTLLGYSLHTSFLVLGTVEFARRRPLERRTLFTITGGIAAYTVGAVVLDHEFPGSVSRLLFDALQFCLGVVSLPLACLLLLQRSPRPRSFGNWLFLAGGLLFSVHALRTLFSDDHSVTGSLAPSLSSLLDPWVLATLGSAMVILLLDRFWAASLHGAEQLREREAELRSAQRLEAVATLAGGVAHEYNNLLTAIVGHADFLAESVKKDPVALGDVEAIRAASERATTLTRQLLAFSRNQELRPQPENLGEVLRSMTRTLQRTIGESAELSLRLADDLPPVLVDRPQIELAFMNLAINSREALQGREDQPGAGLLEVRTLCVEIRDRSMPTGLRLTPGRYVVVQFADNGRGMDDETRQRAIEPFFSTKDTLMNPDSGILPGLGLSAVYGIVRQSGGDVLLSSRPLQGTTISLYLPVTQQRSTRLDAPPPIERHGSRVGLTVLVVDDERAVADVTVRTLKGAGFRVLTAHNGVDALLMAQHYSGSIDLLVTDLVLPGMTGEALARALQSQQHAMATLFFSGYSPQDLLERGIPDPGHRVLGKPFTSEALLERVREVLAS